MVKADLAAKSLKNKALGDLKARKLPQALKKSTLGTKKFPKDEDFFAIAGFVLTEMGQYPKSIPYFVKAAQLRPDKAEYAENLANALLRSGQPDKALAFAEKQNARFPQSSELSRVKIEIKISNQNWLELIDYTTRHLGATPNNPELLFGRARAYRHLGLAEQSSSDIYKAFRYAPDHQEIAYFMATDLHQRGKRDECAEILRDVLNRDPEHAPSLLWQSAHIGNPDAPDLLAQVQTAIDRAAQPSAELEFAKAHLTATINGMETGLAQYARANAIQHRANPYSFDIETAKFDRMRRLFPINTHPVLSSDRNLPTPIFVLGQPRSGTTLVEVMLSSAPDVTGCGELGIALDLTYQNMENDERVSPRSLNDFASEFRKRMPELPEESAAFIDKMPHNYQCLGFLLSAFPDAKAIHMMRDPRDVALSTWIKLFPAFGMNYSSDLGSIAQSANLYRRYMSHWEQIFGERILTVPYEGLVSDPLSHTRRIANFCGIAWNENMVHPENSVQRVMTASRDQVRQKISPKSIGGWKRYSNHLRPLLDGLDADLWPEYDLG